MNDAELIPERDLSGVIAEADELVAILTSFVNTAKKPA
jgi:hypothetical protein